MRQPLEVAAHKIRELPGSKLYIFLPWQAVRDRLEEVVPDYQLSFSDPVYDHGANMVSLTATIEILGVRKSAIAGVKISIVSKEGKNAEIGHCIDRLHAEAIKNAGEAWCIGRYLDDQIGVYKMLCAHSSELDPETRAKLNQMKSQFVKQLKEYSTPKTSRATATQKKRETEPPAAAPAATGGLYPQHNQLIKQIRTLTGHTSQQVEQWCGGLGYKQPSELPPSLVQDLAQDLALSWGESRFQSPELAEASYKGKIAVLTASGMSLAGAIASWMESIEPAKVGS